MLYLLTVYSARSSLVTLLAGFFVHSLLFTPDLSAQDELETLLKKAAHNSAEAVIETAEIHFLASILDAPPTSAELEYNVSRHREAVEESIRTSENPILTKQLKEALIDLDENTRSQLVANAKREVQGVYLINRPSEGGDQLIEFRLRQGYEEEAGVLMTLLTRKVPDGHRNVVLDKEANFVIVSRGKTVVGFDEPQLIGRLQGRLLSLMQQDQSPVSFRCEQVLNDQGEHDSQLSMDIFTEDEGASHRIGHVIIDPKRGYICPLIEEYDTDGRLTLRWECEQFFQVKGTDLWFPEICRYKESLQGRPETYKTISYQFNDVATRFNKKFSLNRFSVPVLSGMGVANGSESWVATCDFSLAINDLKTLAQNSCLSVAVEAKEQKKTNLIPGKNDSMFWLIWLNIVVLFIIVVWYFLRSASKRTTV